MQLDVVVVAVDPVWIVETDVQRRRAASAAVAHLGRRRRRQHR